MLNPAPTSEAPVPTVWRTGSALFVAQGVAGGLGALAWLIAARTHSAAAVGTALALVGALTWAGLVGNLGLGSLLVGVLPGTRRGDRAPLAGVGVTIAAAVGAALGLVIDLGLRVFGGGVAEAASHPLVLVALVIGGGGWSAGIVLDHVAVAHARPRLTIMRAGVSGSSRLVLLAIALLVGWDSAPALVAGWAAAIALGSIAEAIGLWAAHDLGLRREMLIGSWAPLARQGIRTHYGVNVLGQTPPMLLPLMLAGAGRPVQAAAFGAAWQIASIVGMVSPAVATGLFAAGSADRERARRTAAATRRQVLLIVAIASTFLFALAPLLLGAIGPAYAAEGTTALRLLCIGLVADAVSNIEVARLRISERFRGAMTINATILAASLAGAMVLVPSLGATGAALGWLVGELLGASVATYSLRSTRSTRSRSPVHEDLARLRLAPSGSGERGGPAHAPPRRRSARHGTRGAGPARHRRRPAAATGLRDGPPPALDSPEPGGDFAA